MANLLLMPVGSHGDVHPHVALGQALQARGHDVTLLTSPYHEPLVRKAGLPFVGIGTVEDFVKCLDHPDAWHPRRAFQFVAEWGILPWMRQVYQLVADRYVPGRTVVVSSALGFGPRIAQEKLGVPLATVHLQPSMLYSKHAPPELGPTVGRAWLPRWAKRLLFWIGYRFLIDPVVAPQTNAFRAELGLPPVRGFFDRWIHSPQCVLGLFPPWFGPPQPDWPPNVTLTGFPLFDERGLAELPAEVEEFLAAGEPPVVFTPGSAMKQGQAFFAAAVEACKRLGRRGMLLTRFAEQVPSPLPEGVRHFAYVPFSQVFPRAAAAVHHGGIGTTAQALAAGVPQLIMPMAHDQPDNAARVERLGVGRAISVRRFRGPAVAKALAGLIGSAEVREQCRSVAAKFEGADALDGACRAIEALVPEPARVGSPP
jgi:UDP:flavonoid glycosyltransferase YjiC (YdhE family)